MRSLRALFVDDSEEDVELLLRELRRAEFAVTSRRVWTGDALIAALAEPWDLVLSDWTMPGFNGLDAYRIVRERDDDLPFIIVSGTIDEGLAVAAMKAGVHDFVSKDKVARLLPAIDRELREAEVRRRQRATDAEVARQRELAQRGEDRYRAMFEHSPLPMWTYDPETLRFVAVNDAAIQHYGYTRDEFLAMSLIDIRPDEDAAAVQSDVHAASGFAKRRIWRHRKKSGEIIVVEISANDFVADGVRLRLVLVNDVTDRERPPRPPLGLWIAVGLLIAVAVLMAASTHRLVATMDKIGHTYRVIDGLGAIDARLAEPALTKSDLAAALGSVRVELARDLDEDDRAQQVRFDELEQAVARRLEHGIPDPEEVELTRARDLIAAMTRAEHELLFTEKTETARQVLFERIAQVAGIVLSIAILVLAFRRLSRETRLRRTAQDSSRRSEESLAATLESIGDGVIATDTAGEVVRMNGVAEALTGWAMAEAIGRPFTQVFQIVDEETRAVARDPVARVLREGVALELASRVTLVARDRVERPISETASPIRDATGATAGVVVVFRDASADRAWERKLGDANDALERRVADRTAELVAANRQLEAEMAQRQQATEALQRSEEQLRHAQKIEAIGRLTGGIAHDFNNLLSVIISYSEMLVTDLPHGTVPASVAADLDEIHKAGLRAADLTRQLLAFSRQQVLAPKIIDLNVSIAGMEKLLRRVIGEDIELRAVPANRRVMVKVDPGQIEQVIMNLVVNARDAMPRGGKLTIETAAVELDEAYAAAHVGVSAGRYIMLAVSDTGSGMTKEVQQRVFEPFFTTKEQGKGTGLGLSTVFGIIQQSGGTVWLYSELGVGTTFKIYLPETRETTEAVAPGPLRVAARGSGTILLVEDDPQVRALVRGILTRSGYQVLEATDGEDALMLSSRYSAEIHLVVTDVVMPKMSGRELVEKLAVLRPATKVLFMSGYTDDTVVHHGVDQGMAFLQKPVTPDALASKVRELLGS